LIFVFYLIYSEPVYLPMFSSFFFAYEDIVHELEYIAKGE